LSTEHDVRRLALSCLLLGFGGPTPPGWLFDALADGLGGVVLFGSNLGDGQRVGELTRRLREAAGRDIVVAIDEEGGDVTRLDAAHGSLSPGAAALGHLDDVRATEDIYAAIGGRLADAGVTLDLAPVADVNSDPRNPVIGVRSFGADPHLVARHVAAAVRGVQSQGVAACAKHFPGHGATTADSHHEVARVEGRRLDLDEVELPPFVAAITAGARAVMTGHLLVPALDTEAPATVSMAITTGLLRDDLSFAGTVVTDALEMRAIADTIGMERGFVDALGAGADAIETGAQDYPRLVTAIPDAVERAVDRGALTMDRLRDAADRTAMLASRGARLPVPASDGVAARCLEVLGSIPGVRRPVVVEARPPGGMASGEMPWSLAEPLASRVDGVEACPVRTEVDVKDAVERVGERTLVVVLRDPLRHPWQRELLESAGRHPSAVVVDVGWPTELAEGAPTIRTRGISPGLLAAAADVLATGRMAP